MCRLPMATSLLAQTETPLWPLQQLQRRRQVPAQMSHQVSRSPPPPRSFNLAHAYIWQVYRCGSHSLSVLSIPTDITDFYYMIVRIWKACWRKSQRTRDLLEGRRVRAAGEQEEGSAGQSAGASKVYEAQERAVLQEYHFILKKILDRVQKKTAADVDATAAARATASAALAAVPGALPTPLPTSSHTPCSAAPQILRSGGWPPPGPWHSPAFSNSPV